MTRSVTGLIAEAMILSACAGQSGTRSSGKKKGSANTGMVAELATRVGEIKPQARVDFETNAAVYRKKGQTVCVSAR